MAWISGEWCPAIRTGEYCQCQTVKTCREFLWVYLSKNWQVPGSKISTAPKTNNFAASFMRLKLRREHKDDYLEVGDSKVRIGLQHG